MVAIFSKANFDDDEYLSAESSVEEKDLLAAIIDEDEDLAAGLYFSLPDICLDLDFDSQLTEPLFPAMSDNDFLRYYSLEPPSVSGLVLTPKHTPQWPQIEYVPLIDTQTNKVPDFAFLDSLNLQILQACNGLFLCMSRISNLYYICSLATQESEVLPSFEYMENQFALSLAFDPYTSPYYKVICVQKLDDKRPLHQIYIYSCETHLWTLSGEPFDAPGDIDFSDGVFCNGAIHWMRRTTRGLYFDVDEKLLREMPKPPLKEGRSLVSCEYCGESQGRLYYVVASSELPYLELFEMKEDYSGWFLKTRIDLAALAMKFPIMARRSKIGHPIFPRYEGDVLSVVQGKEDEDFEVVMSIPGEVITYNHDKKTAKKLCDLRLRPDDRAVWYRVYSSYQVL